jgi:pimeloyl-ACP methyl ester carboxylesterase
MALLAKLASVSYSASTAVGSGEQIASIGDLELCYETFGDRSDPGLVLIMGLGTQMIAWREEFCERLAAAGFFVVRFDNRDVGRSTKLDDLPVPTTWQLLGRDKQAAGYTLEDMALDVIGLLDHLGIERAHVVGASMGAMIAQTVAIHHPHRVRSLVSIMGSTGARSSGQPQLRTAKVLLSAPPADRAGFVEHMIKTFTLIGSPGFERDEDELRRFAEATFGRGRNPAAGARHLAAIIASGNRRPMLRRITAPTLVIHGRADTLVRPSGGRATARAIPGSTLLEIPGMGHDLPRGAWPQIVDAIAANAAREMDA